MTIEDHVRAYIPESSVGVRLGPPRANAKPVLQVFDSGGRTIAFGKVGDDALSARLVRTEAAVLAELSQQPGCAASSCRGSSMRGPGEDSKCCSCRHSSRHSNERAPGRYRLPRPMNWPSRQVPKRPVGDSSYLARLRHRVDTEVATEGRAVLSRALHHMDVRADIALGFGRWHGDWAPWNMGWRGDRLQVWDWERSCTDVPLGFDLVHFELQKQLRHGRPDSLALTSQLIMAAERDLARWYRVSTDAGREQVEVTVLLYLTEILQRYLADAGSSPTVRLASRMEAIETVITGLIVIRHQVSRVCG